jgi:autotransporter-associated beta strand protein
MKNEKRGGSPLAGLTIAAILLASTAGYVSALSRMFQSPMPFIAEETGFHFDEIDAMRSAEVRAVANSEGSFDRTAPAWLVNALPGYSSSRAREMWYLSLNSSGDRRVAFESYGAMNDTSNPYAATKMSFASPFVQSGGERFASSDGIMPAAPTVANTTNSYTGTTTGSVLTGTNWSLGHVPTVSEDAVFPVGAATGIRTFNNGSLTVGSWDVLATSGTFTLRNATAATTSILTLGGAGDLGNGVSGTAADLLFATGGSTFTITGTNATALLNVVLGQSGNFDAAGTINVSAVISDGGNNFSITKTGAGILSLSGANTFGGGVTLSAGTLQINNGGTSATNSALGTGTFTINGGTITNTSGGAIVLATNNVQIWGGDFTFAGTTGTFNLDLGSGAVTLTATRTLTISGNTSTLSVGGPIGDSGGAFGITKSSSGLGTLIFNGASPNTYTGTTTINGGELDLSKTAGVNAIAGNLVIGDGAGTDTVKLIAADQIANTSDVTINTSGVLNLNGNNETIDALNSASATASLLLGGGTLTVGANNETSFAYAGVSSGTGGLTKTGSGIFILTGVNNYTGDTSIKAGELEVTGSGSLNSAGTIHLGDTAPNSPSAMFTFGNGAGGMTIGNPMVVEASASGTEGTRTILGLATNGASNVYSGVVTMNTNLVVQSAALGGSVYNGPGNLIFNGGSIDVKNHTFEMNSNLRGNNADTYSIQGNVTVNEVLGSSLATGGTLVKDGSGSMILQGTSNTYTGTDPGNLNPNGTQIREGILGIFGDGSLGLAPTNATNNVFFMSSAYNTNVDSIAPTLRANAAGITLAATRNINIASGVTGQIDSNGVTFTIAGNINGAGNLTKIGPGTLALIGANSYTGTTTINAGTLDAATTSALGSTSNVTVNSGGTLLFSNSGTIDRINNNAGITVNGQSSATASINTAGLSEYTVGSVLPGMGALTLQSSSIIDLSNGASILAFANSALQAANWSGTLSIYNWSGNVLTGNGTDQLYFGTDATGLAPSQLAQISFYSDSGTTFLGVGSWATDLDGEVVPLAAVPEPSTWIGAALALGAIGFAQRRKLRRLIKARP